MVAGRQVRPPSPVTAAACGEGAPALKSPPTARPCVRSRKARANTPRAGSPAGIGVSDAVQVWPRSAECRTRARAPRRWPATHHGAPNSPGTARSPRSPPRRRARPASRRSTAPSRNGRRRRWTGCGTCRPPGRSSRDRAGCRRRSCSRRRRSRRCCGRTPSRSLRRRRCGRRGTSRPRRSPGRPRAARRTPRCPGTGGRPRRAARRSASSPRRRSCAAPCPPYRPPTRCSC